MDKFQALTDDEINLLVELRRSPILGEMYKALRSEWKRLFYTTVDIVFLNDNQSYECRICGVVWGDNRGIKELHERGCEYAEYAKAPMMEDEDEFQRFSNP